MITQLFINFFKEHKFLTFCYLLTMLYIPLNSIGMPHLYGKLITILNKGSINKAIYILVILVILWGVIQFVKISSSYIHSKIFPLFLAYVRENIVKIIVDRYKTDYEDLQLGDTITKIIKGPYLFEEIFDIGESFIFRNIIIVTSSFLYLFFYNKKLGGIYLLCIVCILLTCSLYIVKCQGNVVKTEEVYADVHEEIEDTLSNLISVYTSQKTDDENKRIRKYNKSLYTEEQQLENCNNKYRLLFSAVCILIFIVLNFYSLYLYKQKKIKLPNLISIIIINYSLLNTLMDVYYYARQLTDINGRLKVFQNYLDKLPKQSKNNKLTLDKIDTITFKDVSFSYTKDKQILNNINLKIENNDIIGLIGHIGSGKSTLGKLLVRLKEPDSGEITIKNININTINIDNLRDNINFIPQHPKLFNRTLFSNITYGVKRTINEDEIYKLLDELDVNDIKKIFKKMMYSNVGKNGSKLSGGQRQLVWLLRSILKNSKVIILDEPTSSLDEISKEQVIKFINKYNKNKIVILITHDKTLLKHVNRIIEFKAGSIIKDERK
jgi:ABC-type multidrug transport system fused ATPase/permease subunit